MDLAGVPGSTDRINISDSDSDSDICSRTRVSTLQYSVDIIANWTTDNDNYVH